MTIVILNPEGGSGKTTIATNLLKTLAGTAELALPTGTQPGG